MADNAMKAKNAPDIVSIVVLRDGVFPFEDVRKEAGDAVDDVPVDIAAILIGNGHARRA